MSDMRKVAKWIAVKESPNEHGEALRVGEPDRRLYGRERLRSDVRALSQEARQ